MKQNLDLYALCEYKVSLNSIEKLVKDEFEWVDFSTNSEKVKALSKNRPALVKKIIDVIPLINESKRENSLFQLAYGGLSLNNINTLIEFGINYDDIPALTLEELSLLMGGNRASLYMKIRTAFESVEINKGNPPCFRIETHMKQMIESLLPKETITVDDFKNSIELAINENIKVDLIGTFIEKNIKTGLLIRCENGYVRKYKKIKDFLDEDFLNKDILLLRMKGWTLREIAETQNISRQAVSNKERRILSRVGDLEEILLYTEWFQRFDWNQELFCSIFNESVEVYQFLNLILNKGNEPLISLLAEENDFTHTQIEAILKSCESFVDYKGRIVPVTKSSIFEEVIFHHAQTSTNDEKMVGKFNEYLEVNDLDEKLQVDAFSVRGMSERCPTVIRTKSNHYRYFDFDGIDSLQIKSLESFLSLTQGVYSMVKVYQENKEFMEEIDIRTEHELHNLYKRIVKVDGVTYNRMPEFSVGNLEKRDFLVKLFHEQAPIHIDSFVNYAEDNYGLKGNSLHSYINMFLNEYIHEDFIKVDYDELQDEDFEILRNLLVDDIYTIDQLNELGSRIDDDFHDKFLNNMILSKLGFSLKGKYVLSDKYGSIDSYFTELILRKDYFSRDEKEIFNSSSFNQALYSLEKSLDVVKVEKDIYITSKNLVSANVPKTLLLDFREKALATVPQNRFFSLQSIRESGFSHEVENLGFEDSFYNRIIWTSDDVRVIQLSTGYIFIKQQTDVSLKDFVRFLVQLNQFKDIYEMNDYTKANYGMSLDLNRVISIVNNSEMHYSHELSKIFINKNTYFEEIY
ncbi:RNA polymerase sigma factor sigma-70 region 4 domain-containing protein [Rossellomorea vietnamensis]|uniref:hypothetical protein n=1 Tax=Rossellomorea vietnamensis TaxID=218284 RepID=UPI000557162E|nr:hypothetical protein [Rossellomorea vietnamensis]